jgi:hypothetical protein
VCTQREDPVQFDVLRINLLQLASIDQISQTFVARYYFHLRIKDGAQDPDLLKDITEKEPEFPRDGTLRPGAAWCVAAHAASVLEFSRAEMPPPQRV